MDNWGLRQWQARHQRGEKTSYEVLSAMIPALKAAPETAWLKEAPSQVLQQALMNLGEAYKNMFEDIAKARRGLLRWKDVRRPRRRRFDARRSFRFPAIKPEDVNAQAIKLPKVGWVRWRKSRDLKGRVTRATVFQQANGWYVSVLTTQVVAEPAPVDVPVEGIDVGVAQTMAFSSGAEPFHMPTLSAQERAHRRRLERRLARRRKGSGRYQRAKHALARDKARETRRRHDALAKATTEIVRRSPIIAREDLQIQSMTASAKGTAEKPGRNVRQKAGLNRAILERSWGIAFAMLAYKAEAVGGRALKVEARCSSQECSACHHVDPGNRTTQARFACLACGHTENADANAAKVIAYRGEHLLAAEREAAAGHAASGRGADVRPGAAKPRRAVATKRQPARTSRLVA
jgi:putative transposase